MTASFKLRQMKVSIGRMIVPIITTPILSVVSAWINCLFASFVFTLIAFFIVLFFILLFLFYYVNIQFIYILTKLYLLFLCFFLFNVSNLAELNFLAPLVNDDILIDSFNCLLLSFICLFLIIVSFRYVNIILFLILCKF